MLHVDDGFLGLMKMTTRLLVREAGYSTEL